MDTKNKVNIVMCYNQSFAPLARHACRTFSDEKISIYAKAVEYHSNGFKSPGWYKLVRTKVELLQNIFEKSEDGSVVGMMDCDIQCFSTKCVLDVWEMMKKSDHDYISLAESCCNNHIGIWFKPDKEQSNTGFTLIKKNPSTQAFLREVLSTNFEEKPFGDQTVINDFIVSLNLKRVLLNPCLFLHGCCEVKRDAVIHHATCAFNVQEKKDQINWVRQQIGVCSVNWDDPFWGYSYTKENI